MSEQAGAMEETETRVSRKRSRSPSPAPTLGCDKNERPAKKLQVEDAALSDKDLVLRKLLDKPLVCLLTSYRLTDLKPLYDLWEICICKAMPGLAEVKKIFGPDATYLVSTVRRIYKEAKIVLDRTACSRVCGRDNWSPSLENWSVQAPHIIWEAFMSRFMMQLSHVRSFERAETAHNAIRAWFRYRSWLSPERFQRLVGFTRGFSLSAIEALCMRAAAGTSCIDCSGLDLSNISVVRNIDINMSRLDLSECSFAHTNLGNRAVLSHLKAPRSDFTNSSWANLPGPVAHIDVSGSSFVDAEVQGLFGDADTGCCYDDCDWSDAVWKPEGRTYGWDPDFVDNRELEGLQLFQHACRVVGVPIRNWKVHDEIFEDCGLNGDIWLPIGDGLSLSGPYPWSTYGVQQPFWVPFSRRRTDSDATYGTLEELIVSSCVEPALETLCERDSTVLAECLLWLPKVVCSYRMHLSDVPVGFRMKAPRPQDQIRSAFEMLHAMASPAGLKKMSRIHPNTMTLDTWQSIMAAAMFDVGFRLLFAPVLADRAAQLARTMLDSSRGAVVWEGDLLARLTEIAAGGTVAIEGGVFTVTPAVTPAATPAVAEPPQ